MSVTADGRQIESEYVPFERGVPAVLYESIEERENDTVAFLFMHPDADFLNHPGARALAKRGFRSMTMNSHSNLKGDYHLHDLLPELGMGVEYLRGRSGVETVVLAGHSGGAHLSAFYQNVAENGWSVARDDRKIYPAPPNLPTIEPADGLVLLDGHTGYGPMALLNLGGQMASESDCVRIEELDMYAPANGFDPDGPSSYHEEFLEQFFESQAARMDRLIATARSRLRALEDGAGQFVDDEPFPVIDIYSRVYKTDPRLLSHTAERWPLVSANGARTEEVVHSVRGVRETFSEPPLRYRGKEVMPMTVRTFLSSHAVRTSGDYRITESTIEGIDFDSSNASTIGNLRGVSVPLRIHAMTGHYFIVQAEMHYRNAASRDKSLVYIEGAKHRADPLDEKYGDTFGTTFDEVAKWATERFV